jgi:FixJ family two-component response regulator
VAIAVIDDDEAVRESIRMLLESYGYVVHLFENAEQFLLETGMRYDCLLVDHNMPGMSGLELIELHRQRRAAIPAILITGRGSPSVATYAAELGAIYLEKPVMEDVLVHEIEKAMAAAHRAGEEEHNHDQTRTFR